MYRKTIDGLKDTLNIDLEKRLIDHRNRFITIFLGRYRELLPSLIVYEDIEKTSINQLKLESVLRSGYNIVVGKAKNEKIMILGYTKTNQTVSNINYFLTSNLLTKDDINFVIPNDLIPDTMKEISNYDDCITGNFIVLKNKALNFVSDDKILQHYIIELAEIVLSRFSLAMQSKINTFLVGNTNDESINEIVKKLYNGSPYIKVNKYFDPKDSIITLDNSNLALNFVELKKEYQNKISELNTMLGINSLAVEKESGVSDLEAKGNRGFKTTNSNLYLESRQNELDKLNKRYNLDLKAIYNDEVSSEFQKFNESIDKGVDQNFNDKYIFNEHFTE